VKTPVKPPAKKVDWRPRVPKRVAAYFNERRLLKYILLTGLGCFLAGYLFITILFFPGFGRSAIVTVPDLRNRPAATADRMLDRLGLEMERGGSLPNPRIAAGRVLTQVPLPGQEVTRGSEVRVIISDGAERRPVPSIEGLGREAATALLQRMGFTVRVRSVLDNSPEGRVLGMQPKAGTQVPMPAVVVLTLSAGPPKVAAPSVVTLPVDEARARLQAAGLRLGRVTYDPSSSEALGGIASQSPAAGDSIRMGGAVAVVVSGTDPDPDPPAAEPDTAQVEPAEAEEGEEEPAAEPEPAEPPEQPGEPRG
jgi:eukaryotic-like serine/threonine-protein kinase